MNDIEERIRTAVRPYRARDDLLAKEGSNKEPRSPSHRRGVRASVIAAAVVVITLVLMLLSLGRPGGPDPAAASLLRRFATIAQHASPEPAPQSGQYVYSETRMIDSRLYVSGDGKYRVVYSVPAIEQRWLGLDGSGRVVMTTGREPTFATQADENAYQSYLASGGEQIEPWGKSATDLYKPGELTWHYTSTLPTDPAALGQLIDDRQIVSGPSGDWESFALATDLIRDSYARPELRSALYNYMSGLSGVELIGPTPDSIGRRGVALASSHDGVRFEVVFDKRSGDILEERDIALETNEDVYNGVGESIYAFAYAGHPISIETYLTRSRVVDSSTQTP